MKVEYDSPTRMLYYEPSAVTVDPASNQSCTTDPPSQSIEAERPKKATEKSKETDMEQQEQRRQGKKMVVAGLIGYDIRGGIKGLNQQINQRQGQDIKEICNQIKNIVQQNKKMKVNI